MRKSFPPLPVGSSLIAGSLSGIDQMLGIIIDNPSGQWLFVTPTYDYVPPYTMGWTRDLSGGVVSINVVPGNGPAGQVSTQQGDSVLITIDSEPVGNSQGATSGEAFISGFTPLLYEQAIGVAIPFSSGNPNIIALIAIPNKRYRLFTFIAKCSNIANQETSVPIYWQIVSNGVVIIDVVTSHSENAIISLLPGLDMAVGADVQVQANTNWADAMGSATLTYQVI